MGTLRGEKRTADFLESDLQVVWAIRHGYWAPNTTSAGITSTLNYWAMSTAPNYLEFLHMSHCDPLCILNGTLNLCNRYCLVLPFSGILGSFYLIFQCVEPSWGFWSLLPLWGLYFDECENIYLPCYLGFRLSHFTITLSVSSLGACLPIASAVFLVSWWVTF